jgi:D-alanyl-lipoteichoic acid acyltransferase DltB (MBOAT superfamily)
MSSLAIAADFRGDLRAALDQAKLSDGLHLRKVSRAWSIGVLADHLATMVSRIYIHATSSDGASLLLAWAAAIGFTLQIYFDFSGYTDMVLGVARLFGVRTAAELRRVVSGHQHH